MTSFKKRVILICLFLCLVIASLLIGAIKIDVLKLLRFDSETWFVLLNSRIPRTTAIVLSASSLSIAGLIMQSLSRNKFISPSTAGTTSAASLGVLLSVLIFSSSTTILRMVFAFIFAMTSTGFFMLLLRKIKFSNTIYIPLIGIMYGAVISSFTAFLAHQFDVSQILASINIGTYINMSAGRFEMLIVLLIPMLIAIIFASAFNVVAMGKNFSKNLGVNYNLIMTVGLVIVAIISAVTFVVVGPIPFLGLIIPNIVSYLYGDNIKKSIFDVALFGSIFVLISDIIARVIIAPYEVPVSLVMGVIGALTFLIILFRRKKHA